MSATISELPMVECPHCNGTFQWDDYYNVEAGHSFQCKLCEREIHVLFVDHRIAVKLGANEDSQ